MSDKRAQGFLQHIVAEPDDDTPRLIYADWLEEQGDSARAEFIRVQVERATLPKWDARQVWLGLRENALVTKHGDEWKAELPSIKGVKWEGFRRGFVATAKLASFEVLREHAGDCWAATPLETAFILWPRRQEKCESIAPIAGLRELYLSGNVMGARAVDMLADAPLLSTLRVLTIPEAYLMPEGLQRLTASPHLGSVKALRVPGNSIGNRGIQALFDAASLTSLEELDLSETNSYGRYGDDPVLESTGLEALVGWSGMSRLRSLKLSGSSVGQRGLRALLRSPNALGLKELVVRDNGLLGQAMQEFETARPGLQLDVLDLGANPLQDLGAAYLAKAKCLRELKVLELDICEMSPTAADSLAGATFLGSLRRLNGSYNTLRAEGLETLLEAKPALLHTLLLIRNNLGDDGVARLAASPASDTLLELDLGTNGLGTRGARVLGNSKYLRNLLILRLSGQRHYREILDPLRDSPLGKRLAVLDVAERADDSEEIPF